MEQVTVAAVQMYCNREREENIKAADKLVRQAAAEGAQIILLPELFETWYFCQEKNMLPMSWPIRRRKILRYATFRGWLPS